MRVHAPLRRLTAAAAICAMAMSFALPAFAVTYDAKEVKLTHDVGHGCAAAAINDAGQITGGCYTEDDLFSVGSTTGPKGKNPTDLGLLGGVDSYGFGINNNGMVVGEATLAGDLTYHAVLRRPNDSEPIDLGTLGGDYAAARGINDSGQIVGYGLTSSGDSHIFVATVNDNRLVDIGGLSTFNNVARAINKKGIIVGNGATPDGKETHAFYAKSPHYKFVDLGTLGGRASSAAAISDNGLVVGYSTFDSSGLRRAFVVDIGQEGIMKDLGTPAGRFSTASGVNEHGQIVGQFVREDNLTAAAFMCSGDCADFVDLTTVTSGLPQGVLLSYANAINKKGRIIAKGSDNKIYLLTPH